MENTKKEKMKLRILHLFIFICFLQLDGAAQSPIFFNEKCLTEICETIDYNEQFGVKQEGAVSGGIFQGLLSSQNPIVYSSKEKLDSIEINLEFKKHLFVFDEYDDMVEVGKRTHTNNSYEYEILGWIYKRDLFFIQNTLLTDKCVSKKCLLVPKLNDLEPDPIPIYDSRLGEIPLTNIEGTLDNMYFICKEEENRVLIATSSYIYFNDSGKNNIVGWVDRESITLLDSRVILEVNHSSNDNLNKDIPFFYTLAASKDFHSGAHFDKNSNNIYKHYRVETTKRKAGHILTSRFPVLNNSGNEWIECLVLGSLDSKDNEVDINATANKILSEKKVFNIAILVEDTLFKSFEEKQIIERIKGNIENSNIGYKFKISLGLFNATNTEKGNCNSKLKNIKNFSKLDLDNCKAGNPDLLVNEFLSNNKVKSKNTNLLIMVSNSSITLSDINENLLCKKRVNMLAIDTNMDLDEELNFYQNFTEVYKNVSQIYQNEYDQSGFDNISRWLVQQYPGNDDESLVEEVYPICGKFFFPSGNEMLTNYDTIICEWMNEKTNLLSVVLERVREKMMTGSFTDINKDSESISTSPQIAYTIIDIAAYGNLTTLQMQKLFKKNLVSKVCYVPYALAGESSSLMKYGVMLKETILERIRKIEFPEIKCEDQGVELNVVKEQVQNFYFELFQAVNGGHEAFDFNSKSLCEIRSKIWRIPGTENFVSSDSFPDWCEKVDNATSLMDLCGIVQNIKKRVDDLSTAYSKYRIDGNNAYVKELSNSAFFWILEDELP